MKVAARSGQLGTEGAFAVLARARALEAQGRDVIHLEIGEPDFETPPHVVEAGAQALTLLYVRVLSVWSRDDDPGLARTMAALDRELARIEPDQQADEDILRKLKGLGYID